MSTFGGLLKELPGISIDRFDGKNLESTIYFLSHCHADHMVGLNSFDFRNSLLRRRNVFLYASPVTVQILNCKYPELKSKFKNLPLSVATLLTFHDNSQKYFNVTPITAAHCPGSVMFLFESDKNILYTGDYRVSGSDLKKFVPFYQHGQVKKIHKMYLDTTFFSTSFLKFPTRQQTLDSMIRIMKEWFDYKTTNVIQIQTSATYGSEYLFIEIAKKFSMPIHVNQTAYDFYKHIPDMDQAVTLDPHSTRIHSACGPHYTQICVDNNQLVRTIKPSAIYWKNMNLDVRIEDHKDEFYRVCCSSHSSFEEIVEFLMFLKPESVEPNVLPTNPKERQTMLDALQSVVENYKKENEAKTDNSANNFIKLFKIREGENERTDSSAEESDTNLDDLLNSPPRKIRKSEI